MSSNARKKLHAIGVTASEKKQAAQMRYRENRKKKLRSYLERGAQSNHTNNETNLEHLSANPLGGLLGGYIVAASEGGVETKSDSGGRILNPPHI